MRGIIKKAGVIYVLVNLLTAALGFIKAYVYMRFLGFYDVGLIAMIQTIIAFISILQFGLLNGGYILYCKADQTLNKQLNNFLHTFFFTLIGFILILYLAHLLFFPDIFTSNNGMLLIGCMAGVFSICMNWLQNVLIAKGELKELNTINLSTNLLSLIFIFFIPKFGLWPALFLIVSQPILFVLYVYGKYPSLLPDKFVFETKLLKNILAFGLIPFLCSICLQLNDQIERWTIIKSLGLESLGKYNLVLIYSSLFTLIPTSITNIFVPGAIQAMQRGDLTALKKVTKKVTYIIVGYVIASVSITIALMPWLIQLLVPQYSPGVYYVWFILPGVCLLGLGTPFNFLYYVTGKLRHMLISYFSGSLVLLGLFFLLPVLFSPVSLPTIATLKSIALSFITILSFIFYSMVYKNTFKYDNRADILQD